jgi:hypothetical protein
MRSTAPGFSSPFFESDFGAFFFSGALFGSSFFSGPSTLGAFVPFGVSVKSTSSAPHFGPFELSFGASFFSGPLTDFGPSLLPPGASFLLTSVDFFSGEFSLGASLLRGVSVKSTSVMSSLRRPFGTTSVPGFFPSGVLPFLPLSETGFSEYLTTSVWVSFSGSLPFLPNPDVRAGISPGSQETFRPTNAFLRAL